MLTKPTWPLLILVVAAIARSAEPVAVTNALQAALSKNVAHARDWLDQKDYKSLAQSAGGMLLLAELTKAKSDDAAWQAGVGNVLARIGELQSAARGEDAGKCKAAIDALDASVTAAAAIQPTGQAQALARPPAIRPLMLTMDAIQADAKIALLTGNVDAAKKQAHVLAELGKLVSNSRTTEQWTSLAGDFASAATAAATSAETNPQAVRRLLGGVAQRCEACHEKSRPPTK
jgi:cytochrome c556